MIYTGMKHLYRCKELASRAALSALLYLILSKFFLSAVILGGRTVLSLAHAKFVGKMNRTNAAMPSYSPSTDRLFS